MLASNAELSRQLDQLESKYDRQFKVVFDAIRQLMTPTPPNRKQRLPITEIKRVLTASRLLLSVALTLFDLKLCAFVCRAGKIAIFYRQI